jgi:S1-C subfamily serine protease
MAAAVARAGASVVRVAGRRRHPASGVVWSADGVIVTAHHVVERKREISVGLPDGRTLVAELAGRDPSTDLAVLRVDAQDLESAEWAAADTLRVGQLVLALGRPGQSIQATLGVLSALGGAWRTRAGGRVDAYLNTDVLMYPGFSGGPLIDTAGRLLGINSSALRRGASMALPAATVQRTVETLLAHGGMRRGYLGVSTQPVPLPDTLAEELSQSTGLLVTHVEPKSPAAEGGLLMGDTIVALGGEAIRHHDDLLGLLSGDQIDVSLPVRVVRAGELLGLDVTVGERS